MLSHDAFKADSRVTCRGEAADDEFLGECARAIEAAHGDDADRFVSERLQKLAEEHNAIAFATWLGIARELRELAGPRPFMLGGIETPGKA